MKMESNTTLKKPTDHYFWLDIKLKMMMMMMIMMAIIMIIITIIIIRRRNK